MPQTVQEQKKNRKDPAVELLRIIGALMVVGTHVKQGFFTGDGSLSGTRVLIACLVGDGVAVFWLICGFFFPGNVDSKMSYTQIIKKAVRKILIPMLCLSLFTFFFSGLLLDGKSLAESVHHSADEYRELIRGFAQWRNPVSYCGHMWYMYVYFLIMLCFPLAWGMVCWARRSSKSFYVPFFLWAVLLLNDYFHNSIFKFSHNSINGMAGALVYILTGSILYRWRNKFVGSKKGCLAGITMFLGANLLRCYFAGKCLLADPKDTLMLFWYTHFGYISAIGIVLTIWGITPWFRNKEFPEKVICHLGSRTMGIYLIHFLILQKTRNMGLGSRLNSILGISTIGSILYELIYALIIFLISLAIVDIFYCLKRLLHDSKNRQVR